MIDMTKRANELNLGIKSFLKLEEDGSLSPSTLQKNWLSGTLTYLRDVRNHVQIVGVSVSEAEVRELPYIANIEDGNIVSVSLTIRELTEEELTLKAQQKLEGIINMKLGEISSIFENEMMNGVVDTGLGWNIDARRSGTKNDLQNMETLEIVMIANSQTETTIKDADGNLQLTTITELNTIIQTMRFAALTRYTKKFDLEAQILASTTIEDVENITW